MNRQRGFPSTSGLGIIKCNSCGEPLKEHRVGSRCYLLEGERLTVGRPLWGRGDPESPEAKRRRKSRERQR